MRRVLKLNKKNYSATDKDSEELLKHSNLAAIDDFIPVNFTVQHEEKPVSNVSAEVILAENIAMRHNTQMNDKIEVDDYIGRAINARQLEYKTDAYTVDPSLQQYNNSLYRKRKLKPLYVDLDENRTIESYDDKTQEPVKETSTNLNKQYKQYNNVRGDKGSKPNTGEEIVAAKFLEYSKPVRKGDFNNIDKSAINKLKDTAGVDRYYNAESKSINYNKERFDNKLVYIDQQTFKNNELEFTKIKQGLVVSLWNDPSTRSQIQKKYNIQNINDLIASTMLVENTSETAKSKNYVLAYRKPNGIVELLFGPDSTQMMQGRLMALNPEESYKLLLEKLISDKVDLTDSHTNDVIKTTLLKNDNIRTEFDVSKLDDTDVVNALARSLKIDNIEALEIRKAMKEYVDTHTLKDSKININTIQYLETRTRLQELTNKHTELKDLIKDLVDTTERNVVQNNIKLVDNAAVKTSIFESFVNMVFGKSNKSTERVTSLAANNNRSTERYVSILKERTKINTDTSNKVSLSGINKRPTKNIACMFESFIPK